jgi:hypothetical protein
MCAKTSCRAELDSTEGNRVYREPFTYFTMAAMYNEYILSPDDLLILSGVGMLCSNCYPDWVVVVSESIKIMM